MGAPLSPAWGTFMEVAVERAVTVIRTRYQERLSVADLAAEAFFSPFYFSRLFRRELGVSPCQYLTAVRLFEAKRLLQATSLNVADIACRVGYVGIGTFTTRFTALVGVSPGHYRRLPASRMLLIADGVQQFPTWDAVPAEAPHPPRAPGRGGTIVGSTQPDPAIAVSRLFVGVFDDAIPQGPPVAWALVPGQDSGNWRLDDLPVGQWVVIALVEGNSVGDAPAAPHGRPAPDGPAPHGPAPHGPVPDGPAPHGPAPHGPVPHGPAPHGPAPHGPAPHGPAPDEAASDEAATGGPAFCVGISAPVQVTAGRIARVTLRMRRPHRTDPPILIPVCHRLPQLRSLAS